jgi:hypothetical protein
VTVSTQYLPRHSSIIILSFRAFIIIIIIIIIKLANRGRRDRDRMVFYTDISCLGGVLCFCFDLLRLVYPMLTISLDCPFLVAALRYSLTFIYNTYFNA